MEIKRNINFTLEKRKKDGVLIVKNVPIRMRVTFLSKRIELSTGYRIDLSKWDTKKKNVKRGYTNKLKQSSSEINIALLKYYTIVQSIFKEFEVQNIVPTSSQLKELFIAKMKNPQATEKNKKIIFFNVLREFIKERGNQNSWSKATYEKFAAVKNHIMEFNPLVSFETFDEKGLNNYVIFLREKKNMRNSTISKQIDFLKWFLRWSTNKKYNYTLAYQDFKPKIKNTPKKVIFLTQQELIQLREYHIPPTKKYLERVRDVFLFSCFTGLRYSDVYNLRKMDIKDKYIEVTTMKTSDSLVIELNKHSKAILDKYKDVLFEDYKALPVISNQKMNEYLKELAELAELDEPVRETFYRGSERIDTISPKYALLGTHAGRRTFICNALALGIPAQVVMKWTGHSDYKAMKPYIDIAGNIKADAMTKFDEL